MTQPKNQSESLEVQASERQLGNHIKDKSHTATTPILILALVGLVGIIAFFGVKLSRR